MRACLGYELAAIARGGLWLSAAIARGAWWAPAPVPRAPPPRVRAPAPVLRPACMRVHARGAWACAFTQRATQRLVVGRGGAAQVAILHVHDLCGRVVIFSRTKPARGAEVPTQDAALAATPVSQTSLVRDSESIKSFKR